MKETNVKEKLIEKAGDLVAEINKLKIVNHDLIVRRLQMLEELKMLDTLVNQNFQKIQQLEQKPK